MAVCIVSGSCVLPASNLIIVQLYVLFAISTDLHKQTCIRPVLVVFMFLVNPHTYFTTTIDYIYNCSMAIISSYDITLNS